MSIREDFNRAYEFLVTSEVHENPYGNHAKGFKEWIESNKGTFVKRKDYAIHLVLGSMNFNFYNSPDFNKLPNVLEKYNLSSVNVGGGYIFLTPRQYTQLAIESYGTEEVICEIFEKPPHISVAIPLLLSQKDTCNLVEDLSKELFSI